MPWKESCRMDERARFVLEALEGWCSMSALCEHISRPVARRLPVRRTSPDRRPRRSTPPPIMRPCRRPSAYALNARCASRPPAAHCHSVRRPVHPSARPTSVRLSVRPSVRPSIPLSAHLLTFAPPNPSFSLS